MKSQILFIDDDRSLLNSLRRSLLKMRREWDISFALSGKMALQQLEETRFDVVVSDMRMPGMTGDEVLNKVRQHQPNTMRIILSGSIEQDAIIHTVGPAHQYLAKPCDPEILIETIRRGLALQRFIQRKELRDVISGLDSLPTLPSLITELLQELDLPSASVSSVSEIISSDISLTAQVLRLTNSAFFSLPVKATEPEKAVSLLGFDTIRSVVLKAGIFDRLVVPDSIGSAFSRLSSNCLVIGQLAHALAKAEGVDNQTAIHAQCAGTLSHLGSLFLMAVQKDAYIEACKACEAEKISMYEVEKNMFGVGHAEIGAYLLGLWGFAEPVIEAVAYHHAPEENDETELSALTFVHAAQFLCSRRNRLKDTEKPSRFNLNNDYLERLGVVSRLTTWSQTADTFLEKEKCHE